MSLIVPLLVNAKRIGSIIISRLDCQASGVNTYAWLIEMIPRPGEAEVLLTGEIDHNYEDGALSLLSKVLDEAGVRVDD